jgi:uncharacterized membrane protein YbaN (DUF454 family)
MRRRTHTLTLSSPNLHLLLHAHTRMLPLLLDWKKKKKIRREDKIRRKGEDNI